VIAVWFAQFLVLCPPFCSQAEASCLGNAERKLVVNLWVWVWVLTNIGTTLLILEPIIESTSKLKGKYRFLSSQFRQGALLECMTMCEFKFKSRKDGQ
jgi:hypothetical protein